MKPGISLVDLVLLFTLTSLLAVGGVTAALPDIHRQVVDVHGWMTSAEFAELFAIAQAAPGPNVIIATLIGWKVAGFWGALAATVALCLPSSVLAYTMSRVSMRHEKKKWNVAIKSGLAPITIGLITASGALLTKAAVQSWASAVVVLVTLALSLTTKVNPIWLLVCGGLCGVFGLVG